VESEITDAKLAKAVAIAGLPEKLRYEAGAWWKIYGTVKQNEDGSYDPDTVEIILPPQDAWAMIERRFRLWLESHLEEADRPWISFTFFTPKEGDIEMGYWNCLLDAVISVAKDCKAIGEKK